MTTNITITERAAPAAAPMRRALPGWVWFIALWCVGVGGAMSLGFAFKILMNLTLFAVK
ncbi:hypothetical protein [Paraburkholderia phenazinium]|jgi:hypothetical protein|uniref:DUF2474 domain-containing protein n=1 Tax=Paraburkholderia phenazinium TaxID=60549 RepID=A0A1G8G6N7_9BURK|nr:hypothetical protein [Paraburkholderia phenazinium]SDH89970.1 hypothetical protein SAMN05216466_114152 [Paraburkholderia phenazinium]